jgi:hypothetical protein
MDFRLYSPIHFAAVDYARATENEAHEGVVSLNHSESSSLPQTTRAR